MSGGEYKKEAIQGEPLRLDQRFFSVPKSLATSRFSNIGKRLFKYFRAKEYEKLRRELVPERLGKSEVKDFFLAEGYPILDWAVNKASEAKGLALLCEIVDKTTLQKVLLSHDLDILRSFLFLQSGLERTSRYDKEAAESCVAKFKLLLEIDATAVKTFVALFVKAKNSFGCQTEKMETSLKAAIDDLKEQQDSSPIVSPSSFQ